jgi:TRAP-type C4-dicarboxylate transport system permease small subunit
MDPTFDIWTYISLLIGVVGIAIIQELRYYKARQQQEKAINDAIKRWRRHLIR